MDKDKTTEQEKRVVITKGVEWKTQERYVQESISWVYIATVLENIDQFVKSKPD